jgi:hypothetical protein
MRIRHAIIHPLDRQPGDLNDKNLPSLLTDQFKRRPLGETP